MATRLAAGTRPAITGSGGATVSGMPVGLLLSLTQDVVTAGSGGTRAAATRTAVTGTRLSV